MTPQEVKDFYKSGYLFSKRTGFSHVSLINWLRKGYVPEGSQLKLERITKGNLKADWIAYD